ncbi:unnamed protein product, partial [Polarella glacialis]
EASESASKRLSAVSDGAATPPESPTPPESRRARSHASSVGEMLGASASAPSLSRSDNLLRIRPAEEMGSSNPSQTNGPSFGLGQMPRTMVILLFRNGDRLHSGETLFIKRWPPPTMKDLLLQAEQVCRPVIGPARGLYTHDIVRLRSLDEVEPGGIYLLRGFEEFDPPRQFFCHDKPKVPSLRNLMKAKETVKEEEGTNPRQLQGASPHASHYSSQSSSAQRIPQLDSPPWPSLGPVKLPPAPQKWQVREYLGMRLTWGGQGMPHTHHHFDTWTPVLQSPFNKQERVHSMATTSYTSTDRFF